MVNFFFFWITNEVKIWLFILYEQYLVHLLFLKFVPRHMHMIGFNPNSLPQRQIFILQNQSDRILP